MVRVHAGPQVKISHGGLAQLARAPALQAGGQRFESVILHLEGEELTIDKGQLTTWRKKGVRVKDQANESDWF